MDTLKRIFNNKKLLFCYCLFTISILFSLMIFIFQPKKLDAYYPFEYSGEKIEVVDFPIEQHFHNPYDSLRVIHLYVRDQSINNYDYQIDVIGVKTGKNYFSHLYDEYNSDIMILDILDETDEKDFILKISCDECKNVSVSKKKSNDSKQNYIKDSHDDDILEFSIVNFVPNHGYYWYSIVGIVISLMLYPFAKEEKHYEKK